MTTPTDEIRAAAERLRSQSAAATPGPWSADASIPYGHRVGSTNGADWVARTGEYGEDYSQADARYIATMHPCVGAVLADWLNATAVEVTAADGTEYALHADDSDFDGWNAALNLARLINGTAVPAAEEQPHA